MPFPSLLYSWRAEVKPSFQGFDWPHGFKRLTHGTEDICPQKFDGILSNRRACVLTQCFNTSVVVESRSRWQTAVLVFWHFFDMSVVVESRSRCQTTVPVVSFSALTCLSLLKAVAGVVDVIINFAVYDPHRHVRVRVWLRNDRARFAKLKDSSLHGVPVRQCNHILPSLLSLAAFVAF